MLQPIRLEIYCFKFEKRRGQVTSCHKTEQIEQTINWQNASENKEKGKRQ